jgi:streptogramin lyase
MVNTKYTFIFFLIILSKLLCAQKNFINDELFWQEYHEAYPLEKNADQQVRSVAVDPINNIYIATSGGIYVKPKSNKAWTLLGAGGPAYCVMINKAGSLFASTWDGVYILENKILKKVEGTSGPVSVLCDNNGEIFALGPSGVWQLSGNTFQLTDYRIARSVRSATADGDGGMWVTSDVGVYFLKDGKSRLYQSTDTLISAAAKDISVYDSEVWVATLGGISILKQNKLLKKLTTAEGCPSVFVNTVQHTSDGDAWVGTAKGIVKFRKDGSHQLFFSRRWLLNDNVRDIAFDSEGTAWIATDEGVSAIRKRRMNLADKSKYFYDVLMKRNIREPWIAGQCRLPIPGDTTVWEPDDDDNDGEYTSNYLAMESFRYATTRSEEAKQNARKAFDFLKKLQEVTGSNGFFARTIVPANWSGPLDDTNRIYTKHELAEELVKEPRFKPVELRWRKSADGKWLWKGDASSDEMCGHMMGYFFYYELVADGREKKRVASHIASIVDHLMANNLNMMDIDGTHTRWSVWSPDNLNRDPEWAPDRNQNSMEVLSFLKLAYYVTGNQKFEKQYRKLINEEHYLENMAKIGEQNPAWFIYFDVILQAYLYPILLKCEKDTSLLSFYSEHLDEWMERRKNDKNPLINFLYCYSRGRTAELDASIDLLKDTPLDLVSWRIDHRQREDIQIVHSPVLDDEQVSELPPAGIRATIRWDANPWAAVNGNPGIEREPVFWLLPYWMGRYLKMIR